MGKGGPLAFLNKKHFHTGSIRNVEEVWKREQKAAREEARLEELQTQIAQERQLEELAQVAEKAGHARPQDRLDWMYGGGVGERSEAQRKKDEVDEMSKPAKLDTIEDSKSRVRLPFILRFTLCSSRLIKSLFCLPSMWRIPRNLLMKLGLG